MKSKRVQLFNKKRQGSIAMSRMILKAGIEGAGLLRVGDDFQKHECVVLQRVKNLKVCLAVDGVVLCPPKVSKLFHVEYGGLHHEALQLFIHTGGIGHAGTFVVKHGNYAFASGQLGEHGGGGTVSQ